MNNIILISSDPLRIIYALKFNIPIIPLLKYNYKCTNDNHLKLIQNLLFKYDSKDNLGDKIINDFKCILNPIKDNETGSNMSFG